MSNPTTAIFIHQLRVTAIVGIHRDERAAAQPVVLDIELYNDNQRVYTSNQINDTIDYSDVARRVSQLVAEGRFELLETMAQAIADMLLAAYPAVRVQVQVAKPRAVGAAASAGVRITRDAQPSHKQP